MASASSSASTTPMPLTPESTGAPVIALAASNSNNGGVPSSPTGEGSSVVKKSRRQATLFSNQSTGNPKPLKPFSRSAAKRESVLALGSIEHLQQYFTKTGMVNKKNALFDKKHYGLVPAIGGMPLSPTATGEDEVSSLDAILAAQTAPSASVTRPSIPTVVAPHVKASEAHPDNLLPGVIDQLSELVKAWAIDEQDAEQHVDVLPLLRTTTRAIQMVRNYVLSLPDDPTVTTATKGKRKLVPGHSSGPPSTQNANGSAPPPDPLALIRRCSLEVLGTLRVLEETARLPLTDDAYDAQSDGGGGSKGAQSRGTSPSPGQPPELPGVDEGQAQAWGDLGITFSLVQVQGRYEAVPVWEDEEPNFDDEPPIKEKREMWHETLEVGNGWLYRQDITLKDTPREREAVKKYLDAVDDALFPPKEGQAKTERGWETERKKLEMRTSRFASLVSNSARSRSKLRRISSGEHLERGNAGMQAASLLMDPAGGKRRISTGMLGLMGERTKLTAEPEEMEGIREEDGSAGEEGEELIEHELEDDELPDWAKRATFGGDELGRLYAFLHTFIPPSYQNELIPPSSLAAPPKATFSVEPSRSAFLSSLSSGQLLCLAYNVCVRKSNHPWGFVSKEGIHDILSLEKAAAAEGRPSRKTGWTFRRTDNLRLWIGALKLRYMLPIQIPSQILSSFPPSLLKLPSVVQAVGSGSRKGTPLSSPKKGSFPASIGESKGTGSPGHVPMSSSNAKALPDVVLFDAQAVARKDEGWEDILERVLLRWMWKAIDEKRKALPTPIG